MSQPENSLTPGYASAIAAALNLGLAMLAEVEKNVAVAASRKAVGHPCIDEQICVQHDQTGPLVAIFAEALELVRLAADQGRQP